MVGAVVLYTCCAGIGGINAWSEISAMIVSFVVTFAVHLLERAEVLNLGPNAAMLWTVGVTTVTWLVITLLTPPVDRDDLIAFVQRIRTAGPGCEWFRPRWCGAG